MHLMDDLVVGYPPYTDAAMRSQKGNTKHWRLLEAKFASAFSEYDQLYEFGQEWFDLQPGDELHAQHSGTPAVRIRFPKEPPHVLREALAADEQARTISKKIKEKETNIAHLDEDMEEERQTLQADINKYEEAQAKARQQAEGHGAKMQQRRAEHEREKKLIAKEKRRLEQELAKDRIRGE